MEVTTDEEKSGYKAMLNQGYAAGGHRLDNIYNCQWYIDQMTKADGTVRCTTHATLNALISSNVRQEAVPDSGGVWGLHYAQDVDTYFVLEVMKRVKYRNTAAAAAKNGTIGATSPGLFPSTASAR